MGFKVSGNPQVCVRLRRYMNMEGLGSGKYWFLNFLNMINHWVSLLKLTQASSVMGFPDNPQQGKRIELKQNCDQSRCVG